MSAILEILEPDTDVAAELSQRRGREVVVLNDADAAGLAEMRYGAGRAAARPG